MQQWDWSRRVLCKWQAIPGQRVHRDKVRSVSKVVPVPYGINVSETKKTTKDVVMINGECGRPTADAPATPIAAHSKYNRPDDYTQSDGNSDVNYDDFEPPVTTSVKSKSRLSCRNETDGQCGSQPKRRNDAPFTKLFDVLHQ